MKKFATLAVACVSFLLVAQIPLPPAPTRAHLWSEVGKRLEVDRAIMTVIVNDEWLSKKIADAGIADISKTPSNQPLPHDIITGWPSSKRFKIALVDTEKESQMTTLINRITALEKTLEDSRKTVALNSAVIQGHIKRIADKVDPPSAAPHAPAPEVPVPTDTESPPDDLDVPEPSAVPTKPATDEPKKKKPFFPPFSSN